MSAIPKPRYTEAEYLALERQATYKSEYFQGEIFAMAGSSSEHNLIAGNLRTFLHAQLRQNGCRMYVLEMRFRVDTSGLYKYPNAMIVCGKTIYADADVDTVVNPKVVFEVLSDSTEAYDRGEKFRQFAQIPTVQEYILISQHRPGIEQFVRQGKVQWLLTRYDDAALTLTLSSIQASIGLQDIYDEIEFPMYDPLTFAAYQQWFRDYDAQRGLDADRPLESLTHLSEEMGEIARHLLRLEGVKPMGDSPRDAEIAALALELSDAFVFLTKLANHYGIEWDTAIRNGMAKAEARWDVSTGQDEAQRRATHRNS